MRLAGKCGSGRRVIQIAYAELTRLSSSLRFVRDAENVTRPRDIDAPGKPKRSELLMGVTHKGEPTGQGVILTQL